jgi:hypothetical protein
MATLTVITFPSEPTASFDIDGEAESVAAAVGGDEFRNIGSTAFWAKNASGGPITITFAAQTACEYGVTHDLAVVVADGFEGIIVSSFDAVRFNDANGLVQVTYSDVTSLDVAAVRLA